jgi:uncharacterized protein YcbK (DUF882 family)
MNNVEVNKSIRLSQHYTLGEMTKTGTGIPNIPSRVSIENLRNICENWLEEMRYDYNTLYCLKPGEDYETSKNVEPVIITSGFRSEDVNRAVGGSPSSNHLSGCAVDIRCAGFEQAVRYATILLDIADDTGQDYDELFIERKKGGRYWLHFAVRPEDNRRKTMFLQVG